jgi:hypothetical protein
MGLTITRSSLPVYPQPLPKAPCAQGVCAQGACPQAVNPFLTKTANPAQVVQPVTNPHKVRVHFGQWHGEGATLEEALQPIRTASYNHVLGHENSHLAGLGNMAASGANLIKDGNGITVAGNVQVKRFGLDPANPWLSMQQAQQVIKGAGAPGAGDMSGADSAVLGAATAVYNAAAARAAQLNQRPQLAVQG